MSADEPRPTPIQQVLRCAELLREGWHSKSALAARLGVTERTVKRYLAAIQDELDGVEWRLADERGAREYRIRTRGWAERRRGSPHEIMAVAMAERFFAAFDPGGVADLLDGPSVHTLAGRVLRELDAVTVGGAGGSDDEGAADWEEGEL